MKPSNLSSLFHQQVRAQRDARALRHRRDGLWQTLTWTRWDELSSAIAAALVSLGVDAGDTVGILSRNSGAWLLTDIGVLKAGAVPTPFPLGMTQEDLTFVVKDSGARVVFVENPYYLQKLLTPYEGAEVPFDKVVLFENECTVPSGVQKGDTLLVSDLFKGSLPSWLVEFDDLLVHGDEQLTRYEERLVALRDRELGPSDPAMVCYTSGTTGLPKGVVLSHGSFLFEVERIAEVVPLGPRDEQLLFLPLSHILGNVTYKSILLTGSRLAIGAGFTRLLEDIREVNPTYLTGVPIFCEKLVERIKASMRGHRGVSGLVFDWARGVSSRATQEREAGGLLSQIASRGQQFVAEQLVTKEVSEIVGSRLRFLICGGAHLNPATGRFLESLGVHVLEGYGLTETTAASHLNRPGDVELGTVGPPLRGVECRVSPEGEIQLRGENLLLRYHNDPEGTAAAFTKDGWYRTGDVGSIRPDGRLVVTGKAKNLIVTSNGRNIPPMKIERLLLRSPFIRQAAVFGDNRPFLVALVVPELAAIHQALPGQHEGSELHDVVIDDEVRRLLEEAIEENCRELPSFERVKGFALLPRDLTSEDGDVTATHKLRRGAIYNKYEALIEELYG
jgi:long-chain acyl-CoA synthetase